MATGHMALAAAPQSCETAIQGLTAQGVPLNLLNQMADRAVTLKKTPGTHVVIVDYSKPKNEKRMFVIDLAKQHAVAYHTSHGTGSVDPKNPMLANTFSNSGGTQMTSLGFYSLADKMDVTQAGNKMLWVTGLDPSNDNAATRKLGLQACGDAVEGGKVVDSAGSFCLTAAQMNNVGSSVAGSFLFAGESKKDPATEPSKALTKMLGCRVSKEVRKGANSNTPPAPTPMHGRPGVR